jgi:hypothetical protein
MLISSDSSTGPHPATYNQPRDYPGSSLLFRIAASCGECNHEAWGLVSLVNPFAKVKVCRTLSPARPSMIGHGRAMAGLSAHVP